MGCRGGAWKAHAARPTQPQTSPRPSRVQSVGSQSRRRAGDPRLHPRGRRAPGSFFFSPSPPHPRATALAHWNAVEGSICRQRRPPPPGSVNHLSHTSHTSGSPPPPTPMALARAGARRAPRPEPTQGRRVRSHGARAHPCPSLRGGTGRIRGKASSRAAASKGRSSGLPLRHPPLPVSVRPPNYLLALGKKVQPGLPGA